MAVVHAVYNLLCTNGTDLNPNGMCNVSLTPRQDLIAENPEWFYPHPDQCRTEADRAQTICISDDPDGDCQPLCQSIAGELGPANETYGQVCWHNQSLVKFLVAQAVQVRGRVSIF